MHLSAIHHVAIIVSDYQASKDFYVNKLGFSIIRENYRPERNDWKLDLRLGEAGDLNPIELEIFGLVNPPKGYLLWKRVDCGIWRSRLTMWKLL